MNRLKSNSATPLYVQLADKLRRLVDRGKLGSGDQIMSEQTMIDKYGVSRITVRKAIDLLVEENILVRKQGKGTYVAYPGFFEDACIRSRSFTASLLHSAATPSTRVLAVEVIPVDQSLREKLTPPPAEEEMLRIFRLRYIDGQPAVFEIDYLPMRFLALMDMDLNNRSLYEVLHEKEGAVPTDFSDRFAIVQADQTYAQHLLVEPGHPLLCVNQTVFDKDLNVVYYNEQIIKTETYTYGVKSYLE